MARKKPSDAATKAAKFKKIAKKQLAKAVKSKTKTKVQKEPGKTKPAKRAVMAGKNGGCGVGCGSPSEKPRAEIQNEVLRTYIENAPPPIRYAVEEMADNLEKAQAIILNQADELARLASEPLLFGTVVSEKHEVNPEAYEIDDRVLVIDEACGEFFGKTGKIIKGVDPDDGRIRCEFFGIGNKPHFRVGLSNVIDPDTKKPYKTQVQLLMKNDGTNIVVAVNGKLMEVWNQHRFNPKRGDTAKVLGSSNQVVEIIPSTGLGALCDIIEVLPDEKLLVSEGGTKHVVISNYPEAEVGDTVILDGSKSVTIRHIGNESSTKYKIAEDTCVTWDSVGGQEEAKQEIYDALVLPHKHKDVFEHYKQRTPAGFLLYGPPGCGKTLIGKAAAHTLAELHNAKAVQSGFNYVKGPEILSMWVGESEANSRAIFARMRKHYEIHGYPSVTFVDECDAIFSERGSSHAQKWHDTLVAMWLAEMDGFDRKSGILIFATNRPKAIDGAVVRPGRIDKHIKVPRPDRASIQQIIKIHLGEVPLYKTTPEAVSIALAEDLVENVRPLYRVRCNTTKKEEQFCLINCVSGAMLESIISHGKSLAMRRDIANGKFSGVKLDDFREAVETTYRRYAAINHQYDLADFYEIHGMKAGNINLEQIAAVA